MKLACDLIKPWLVPYSEGTLRAHRPSLHAAVRRHLSGCPSCRQDEVLLHKTAMALRQHSQMNASWSGRRSRPASTGVPLSSRVLQSVQAERGNLARRASQTARRAYPMIAYGTSVALLCTFFAFLTQPSIARPWFDRYFSPRPHAGQSAKRLVKPPYPMHDPFAVPAANGANSAAGIKLGGDPFDPSSVHSSIKTRTASFSPWAGQPKTGKAALPTTSPTAPNDVQAREAMMTAEQAEEKRIATQATQPAPAASNPVVFGGFVAAPFVKPVSVSTSAPAIAGRSITIDTGNKATSTINTQPSTQPKITSAPSASAAQAQPVPPIPDPINQDPAPEASSNSSQ